MRLRLIWIIGRSGKDSPSKGWLGDIHDYQSADEANERALEHRQRLWGTIHVVRLIAMSVENCFIE